MTPEDTPTSTPPVSPTLLKYSVLGTGTVPVPDLPLYKDGYRLVLWDTIHDVLHILVLCPPDLLCVIMSVSFIGSAPQETRSETSNLSTSSPNFSLFSARFTSLCVHDFICHTSILPVIYFPEPVA